MSLAHLFSTIAVKRLSSVETDPGRSNQHEFNGSAVLRNLFGDERRPKIPTLFLHLDEHGVVRDEGTITWYDAREQHPERSEYRCYYTPNDAMERMRAGDLVLLGVRADGCGVVVIGAPKGSTAERQVSQLFGVSTSQELFRVIAGSVLAAKTIGDVERLLLAEIAPEADLSADSRTEDDLDKRALDAFPNGMPRSAQLSELAREIAVGDPLRDPDGAIVRWNLTEERLFRALERREVCEWSARFNPDDIDGFLSYSLSLHNRRKSRAGHAFESHVGAVLEAHRVPHERQVRTEPGSKVDFLVPGIVPYRRSPLDESAVLVLAAKRTCKDRWRQVLDEARLLRDKYLLTLEPAISENETTNMARAGVRLVIPSSIHGTYTDAQRQALMSVKEFINLALTVAGR